MTTAAVDTETEPEPEPELELRDCQTAAKTIGYHPSTVRGWAKTGILTRYGGPGKILVDMAEVRALVKLGPTKHPEPPRRPPE